MNEQDKAILPRLKPAAEELKIQCSKLTERMGVHDLVDLHQRTDELIGDPIVPIKLRDITWTLDEPRMTLRQFAEIMGPFLASPSSVGKDDSTCAPSVLEPIASAIDKAGLTRDDLDMVLFIGGSSANPLIRRTIEHHMGRFVDCVAPRDLHSHVSQGAAIHSLYLHGLGQDLIRPITSEPIYVVTRNDNLRMVIQAGSPVPSPATITTLTVDQDRQTRVELPFCVSGRDKILAVVTVRPPVPPGYFDAGQTFRISCRISRDKLLAVKVYAGNAIVASDILNPLANAELLPRGRRLLQARQALNQSVLAGKGRPTPEAVLTYAHAAQEADQWREAAEMYEAAERLDPESNHAVSIAFNYWNARDFRRSSEWSLEAHERAPNCVTAYNCALDREQSGEMEAFTRLMEESLGFNSRYVPALTIYGHALRDKGDPRGMEFVSRAFGILTKHLVSKVLSSSDCASLERNATTLGKQRVLADLREYRKTLAVDDSPVREDYLAASTDGRNTAAGKGLEP